MQIKPQSTQKPYIEHKSLVDILLSHCRLEIGRLEEPQKELVDQLKAR
jgi:hypothetical protein